MFIRCLQEYINIVVVVPVSFHVVAIGSSLGKAPPSNSGSLGTIIELGKTPQVQRPWRRGT